MSANPLTATYRGVWCFGCDTPFRTVGRFQRHLDHDCPGPAPSRDARDAIDAAARGGGPA